MESLIKTLKDLKENRRLSSECEVLVSPFVGKTIHLSFSFLESESTFASRLGDQYKDGKTVIAKLADTELECAILFPKTENDWVEGLAKEDEFQSKVTVLKFDVLYQRVVLGFCSDQETEQSTEKKNFPLGDDRLSLESEAREGSDDSEREIDERETFVVQPDENGENKAVTNLVAHEKKSEPLSNDAEFSEEKGKAILDDSKIANKEVSSGGEVSSEQSDSAVARQFRVVKRPKKDNAKLATPLPLQPSLPPKKTKIENDPNYLDQLRDKRYESGPDSLTDEEKEALANDIKINAASRQKDLEANKEKVNKGGRAFFGFILVMFSLNSCGKGGGFFAFVVFCFGIYLLFPFLKNLKEMGE